MSNLRERSYHCVLCGAWLTRVFVHGGEWRWVHPLSACHRCGPDGGYLAEAHAEDFSNQGETHADGYLPPPA